MRDLVAGYGGVPVLHGVGLHVASGELLLVLGPNGAGKSTLLRALAGFVKVTGGEVTLAGATVTNRRPEQLARQGLRLVFDGHRVFPGLSVRDNLRLGGSVVRSRPDVEARIDDVLAMFPGLDRRRDAQAHQLSGGERQMLALGQAFVSRPRVLLCDEPSLGLAQALLPGIWDFLASRAAEGTAVIVVEQLVDATLEVADRAVVLDGGAVAAVGPAAEILRGPVLRDIYFRDRAAGQPASPTPS